MKNLVRGSDGVRNTPRDLGEPQKGTTGGRLDHWQERYELGTVISVVLKKRPIGTNLGRPRCVERWGRFLLGKEKPAG
jgi:hypothetical protein